MTRRNDKPSSLTIVPAPDGGYTVETSVDYGPTGARRIVFAGELHPCLDYVANEFEPPLVQRSADAEVVGFAAGRAR